MKNNLLNYTKNQLDSENQVTITNAKVDQSMEDVNKSIKQVDLTHDKIPECFPQTTTKKFVEVKSGEIIYLKETGEAYYQRTYQDPSLILIQDLRQLTLKDSPMSVSSLTLQPDMT